jgi:hypothetical protein
MSSARHMSDVQTATGSREWVPPSTTTYPNPGRIGSIAKSSLIVFTPQRLAEGNWQILVFFPGVKGECAIHFDSEDAAKQWIAQLSTRERAAGGTQPNRR